MLSEEVHVSLKEHLADANNSSLRYGHYQILAADNVSRSISAALGNLMQSAARAAKTTLVSSRFLEIH